MYRFVFSVYGTERFCQICSSRFSDSGRQRLNSDFNGYISFFIRSYIGQLFSKIKLLFYFDCEKSAYLTPFSIFFLKKIIFDRLKMHMKFKTRERTMDITYYRNILAINITSLSSIVTRMSDR